MPWQLNEDGDKLIGHMILRKSSMSQSGTSILGLKVVGGRLLDDGTIGALIEKVKEGSPADIDGQLKPGEDDHIFFSFLKKYNEFDNDFINH